MELVKGGGSWLLIAQGDLKTVDNLTLRDFQRILSGSSTISGGLGSGWALV